MHISAANVVNTPSTYVPLLQTERLAGNEPMIDETYDVLTPTLEVDGLIGDLAGDLKAGTPYKQSYWLKTFEASYIPPKGAPFGVGQPFALANEADATVIMYNENEFQKAGVPFPKNGWTWNQMLADAAKLRIGSGNSQKQYGICERPDWQAEYNPVLKAYGVTAFTETKGDLGHPRCAQGVGAHDRSSAERACRSRGSAAGSERLVRLRAVLRVGKRQRCRSRYVATFPVSSSRSEASSSTTSSRCPRSKVAVIPTGGGSLGWCLAPGAVHNKVALAFLHYLFSAAGQAVAEKTFGVVPAVASLNGPNALWRHLTGGPANSEAYVIAANTATIAPQTPGTVFDLSNTDIPNAITAATTGHQSIASVMKNLQNEMDAAYLLQ